MGEGCGSCEKGKLCFEREDKGQGSNHDYVCMNSSGSPELPLVCDCSWTIKNWGWKGETMSVYQGVVWTVHIDRKQERNGALVCALGNLLLSNLRYLLFDVLTAACTLPLLYSHYREIKSFIHRKWASHPCWCQRLLILCRRCQVSLRTT